jgi:hypothetical protein
MEAVMPAGRPTKYKPEFCDIVIKCGREGMGKAEMAAQLEIAYSNFDIWQHEHPEFQDAVKEAVRQSQAWWERQGRLATFGSIPGFNATSYIFQMKNRFKEDWREKQDVDVTSNGATISLTSLNLKNLTDAELESMSKMLSKAQGQ